MTTRLPPFSNSVPILLLPPSEGKALDGRTRAARKGWDPDDGVFGAVAAQRLEVAEALVRTGGGTAKMLGVGGEHLLRAQSANSMLLGAPTMPAFRRYTGVVWDHLDPSTLPADARRRIVIVSALLGLQRATDPTPDYRLKMSANLPPIGNLSTWWRPVVTSELERFVGRKFVVDLLPQEHRSAWAPKGVRGISVELIDPRGASGGHFAKAAKGELARAILTGGLDVLDRWQHERFELSVTPLPR